MRPDAEFNHRLLTAEESKEYHRLKHGPWTKKEQWVLQPFRRAYTATALFIVASLWTFARAVAEGAKMPQPNTNGDPFLYLLLAIVVVGTPLVLWILAKDARAYKERLVSDYLDSIDYEERAKEYDARIRRRSRSGSGDYDPGPHYWATGDYDPDRYYRETRGWSPEYTNYVRDAYGDLDTYESNRPD